MRNVTLKQMYEELLSFIEENKNSDYVIETSPLQNNIYRKSYYFENGASWWETNEFITEEVELKKYGLTFKTKIKYLRTEYWNTKLGISSYVYQIIK